MFKSLDETKEALGQVGLQVMRFPSHFGIVLPTGTEIGEVVRVTPAPYEEDHEWFIEWAEPKEERV